MFNVHSLATFKRFLALPGATVTITRHDFIEGDLARMERMGIAGPARERAEAKRAVMFAPRTARKLQTNGVYFSDGSWLGFPKAGDFKFLPESDEVMVDLEEDSGRFEKVMVYKLGRLTHY